MSSVYLVIVFLLSIHSQLSFWYKAVNAKLTSSKASREEVARHKLATLITFCLVIKKEKESKYRRLSCKINKHVCLLYLGKES